MKNDQEKSELMKLTRKELDAKATKDYKVVDVEKLPNKQAVVDAILEVPTKKKKSKPAKREGLWIKINELLRHPNGKVDVLYEGNHIGLSREFVSKYVVRRGDWLILNKGKYSYRTAREVEASRK